MSSYIMLAVRVPLGMDEAIETGTMIRRELMAMPWVEEVFLLNTIPATDPGVKTCGGKG